MRLFHGGIPGLRPGDVVLPGQPRHLDGCAVCAANKRGESHRLEPLPHHPDRVYVTTDREYGRFYASKFPRGDLYTVEPVGELTPAGEEDPFPTWSCERAIVRGVVDRYVMLTPKQRNRLLARWSEQDLRRAGLPQDLGALVRPKPGQLEAMARATVSV